MRLFKPFGPSFRLPLTRFGAGPARLPAAAGVLAALLVLAIADPAGVQAQTIDPAAYAAALTPGVSLALLAPVDPLSAGAPTNVATTTAVAIAPPVLQGRSYMATELALSSGGRAPAAVVTLNYGVAQAGQTVWVQPLRGGTCTVAGTNGGAVFGHGLAVTLDATGSAVMTFQPPDRPGIYKVLTRLFNVNTIFPFIVPQPGS